MYYNSSTLCKPLVPTDRRWAVVQDAPLATGAHVSAFIAIGLLLSFTALELCRLKSLTGSTKLYACLPAFKITSSTSYCN
jgi:hypothetical protein